MNRLLGLLSVSLLLVGTSPVNAQKQCGSDCVPEHLVAALLGQDGTADDVDVSVGTLPEGFPNDFVLPDTAQVIGGAELGSEGTSGFAPAGTGPNRSVVIATAPSPPAEIQTELNRSLSENGWVKKEMGLRRKNIFQSEGSRFPQAFCRDNTMLQLSLSRREDDGSQLRIEFWNGGGTSRLCNIPPGRPPPNRNVPMPSLQAPTGATVQSDAGRFSDNSVFEHPTIQTDLEVSNVASHYATELEKEGWTRRSESVGNEAVHQVWEFEDESGRLWFGLLMVADLPSHAKKTILFHLTKQ